VISFVIPAYNEEVLIGRCIASIRAEVTCAYEIIVVDNASTDNTSICASEAGARVLYQPIKGTNAARQMGYLAAVGDLIALIDADSEIPAGWSATALRSLNDPTVVAVSGPPCYTGISRRAAFAVTVYYVISGFLNKFWPMTQGGNCVVRRSALDAVGGFDMSFTFYGDDADTAVRLAKVGRTKLIPEMWIWSSPRRMQNDGWPRSGIRYITNYLWVLVFGKPWSKYSKEIREKGG
jgi:glycosyltransferase involved in cell wall biosynthesis